MTAVARHVEISAEILAEAKRMNIDATGVAEQALIRQIQSRRSQIQDEEAGRLWREENAEAIAWSNKRFEEHGFPFPQYRRY